MPLILDFDGVIADSGAVVLEVVNTFALERGQPPLTQASLAATSPQALRRAWRLRFYEVPALLRRARQEMYRRWESLMVCPQILAPLAWSRANSLPLAILSSNGAATLEAFTNRHLPDIPFACRLGDVPLWRKHIALRRLLRRRGWPAATTIYLGDETRDMVAAQRAGLCAWGVTWGKDTAAALTAAGATCLLHDGEQAVTALARHQENLAPRAKST